MGRFSVVVTLGLVVVGALLAICTPRSDGAPVIRVLFIGNSLTAANALPQLVEELARSEGIEVSCDSYTRGGARLAHHAADPAVHEKLAERRWDFVVLQEQSQYPGFGDAQLARDVYPHGRRLSDLAREANPEVGVVFYMTMARRNGDPANQQVSPELLTYTGMQRRVNRCYEVMAEENRAEVAPVGRVWMAIRDRMPEVNLYGDDIHPNRLGSHVAACVIYATLFDAQVTGSAVPPRLTDQGQELQGIVDEVLAGQGPR